MLSRIAFWTECFFNLRDQWFWTLGYAFTPASSLPDPTVVSKSIPVCERPVQPAQGLLHKSWPETTRQSELCWISSRFYFCCCSEWTRAHSVCWRQPAWDAPHPHPWEEHLITKVTFCMSALNLPLTREPPQTWGRQRALGGIIAPAALCCLDVPLCPVHPPLLRNPHHPPDHTPHTNPALALLQTVQWQAESRKNNLLLVALFLCNMQTRSQTNETKHKHTLWIYKRLWELSLFNEGHNGVNPG